jgi:hypothetical protein
MATPAQIHANQQNAQKSTGPRSPEGKAASAQNAAKHGLASAFRVLQHEDQDEFGELLTSLRDEHQPATEHQAFLVEQLAKTHWILARAQRLETLAFDQLAGAELDPSDPDSAIIAKISETNPNVLSTLQRYAQNAERSYYKAFRELAASKKIQNEADYAASRLKAVFNAPLPDHPAYGPSPTATQYGHVPQLSPKATEIRQAARAGGGTLCY